MSDFQTDSRDLQVKVDNPQKHLETLETYITFRITTKVSFIPSTDKDRCQHNSDISVSF